MERRTPKARPRDVLRQQQSSNIENVTLMLLPHLDNLITPDDNTSRNIRRIRHPRGGSHRGLPSLKDLWIEIIQNIESVLHVNHAHADAIRWLRCVKDNGERKVFPFPGDDRFRQLVDALVKACPGDPALDHPTDDGEGGDYNETDRVGDPCTGIGDPAEGASNDACE